MNRDTRFSPMFKTPNRMKKELRRDEVRNTPLFLKILVGFLFLVLVAQIYHKRGWFMDIPAQSPVQDSVKLKEAAPADTTPPPAPPVLSTLPEAPDTDESAPREKPGLFNRIFSRFHQEPAPQVDEIFLMDAPLDSLFKNLGLEKIDIRRKIRDLPKPYIEERIPLPKGKPLPEYALLLTQMAAARNLRVAEAYESEKDTSVSMEIWGKERLVRKIILSYGPYFLPGYARLAFVLEGAGENFTPDIAGLFSGIKRPMTLGLVPAQPYTDKIYQLALQNGFEVLCQLPMENIPFKNLGERAIYKHLPLKKIQKLLLDFSLATPESKGYSIFGGGLRIVENEPEILKTVLAHVKAEGKYFIDNSFASRSRVKEFADADAILLPIPLGYADTESDPVKQKDAVLKYANIVRKTGKGVILFKDAANAGKVLELVIPAIEAYGIKIVTVSSLFK